MRLKARRLTILFVAALIAVAVVGGCIHFRHARPEGKGPAGPPVPRELFAQPWTERPVLLLGLGDSITAGFGARKGYSYFDRLAGLAPEETPDMAGINLRTVLPNIQARNLSVSGSTSLEHVERQIPLLQTNSIFGLVVLTTGGNDIIHNYGRTPPREGAMYGASLSQAEPWIRNFEERLQQIILQIQNRFPEGCLIFLANIYDPTDGVGDIERAGLPAWKDGLLILERYNEIIRRTAETHENVHLVDIHQTFLGHGIHCTHFWRRHYDRADPHYWYYHNLEDPNERGYDAIRRLYLLEIAKHAGLLRKLDAQ